MGDQDIHRGQKEKKDRDNAQRMFNFRGNIAATVVWDDMTK